MGIERSDVLGDASKGVGRKISRGGPMKKNKRKIAKKKTEK